MILSGSSCADYFNCCFWSSISNGLIPFSPSLLRASSSIISVVSTYDPDCSFFSSISYALIIYAFYRIVSYFRNIPVRSIPRPSSDLISVFTCCFSKPIYFFNMWSLSLLNTFVSVSSLYNILLIDKNTSSNPSY